MAQQELVPFSFFIVENGLSAGREVPISDVLESNPVFIIGRDPRAHLTLGDPEAAPSHAVVEQRGDNYQIEARFPKLTVLVNGKAIIGAKRLEPGDQIQIGTTILQYGEERRRMPVNTAVTPVAALVPTFSPSAILEPRRSFAASPALAAAGNTGLPAVSPHTEIYFPPSSNAVTGPSLTGMVLGLASVLIIVVALAFSFTSGTVEGADGALSQFAFNDGNATVIMFDADW